MYKILPILLFAYSLAVTTKDIYDNSYALIIGIDKYENVSNLDYAVKDANSITTLLRDNFNFPSKNIQTLLNEEATYSNIRNSLSEISSSAKANDRVLIYFAGHGMTKDLPDGGEMGYLLPVDGIKDNLYASAIPMNDLKDLSYMSKAKHMLFLVDACYGGLAAVGKRGLDATNTTNYIKKVTNIKSRQIITAGGKAEQVIEKPEWGHSAYTMNLLRGLRSGLADSNEDGYITADELGDYLTERVTIDSDNQQTPQSRRLTSHEGEFIFINNQYEQYGQNQVKHGISIDYGAIIVTDNSHLYSTDSNWGEISVKDRLKKRLDEKSWSEEPIGFGEGYFGCTDSSASNFNPDVYEDDGSCKYNAMNFSSWKDCLGCYEFIATISSAIIMNNEELLGDNGDIFAAFDEAGNVRGIAGHIVPSFGNYEGKTLYEMTLRSHAEGDLLSFKYYDASINKVLDIAEKYEFIINDILGDFHHPIEFNIVNKKK